MRIPDKLKHGDKLGNLFEKFNTVIDYLREIKLVAGSGIRLNQHVNGTTIESTATAAGGGSPAGAAGHSFDAKIVNTGTAESPVWKVRIFNSTLPDSPYAGIVSVYEWDMSVPVSELVVTTQDGFFVIMDVTYVGVGNPPFSIQFSLLPYSSDNSPSYTTYRAYIAEGKLPSVESRMTGDIIVYGRWA